MRWWLLLFILWASPALAQWVNLVPCGQKILDGNIPQDAFKGPAPNLPVYWVWVPYVVAIIEIKPKDHDTVVCSEVQTVQGARLVLGTADEVLKKLGKK